MVVASICGAAVAIRGGIVIGHLAGSTGAAGSYLTFVIVILIIALLYFVGIFCLGWTLKSGAEQGNYAKCCTWMIFTGILLFLTEIGWIHNSVNVSPYFIFGMLGDGFYGLFTMLVVYKFMQEIKSQRPAAGVVHKI
jgi:hypothetical protein